MVRYWTTVTRVDFFAKKKEPWFLFDLFNYLTNCYKEKKGLLLVATIPTLAIGKTIPVVILLH